MKKAILLTVFFLLGVLATEAFSQTLIVTPYQIQVPSQIIVVPPTQTYVVPPPAPPKPNFQTPLRDGIWYSGVYLNRAMWYNRYWRYKRLEGLIGPQIVAPIPQGE